MSLVAVVDRIVDAAHTLEGHSLPASIHPLLGVEAVARGCAVHAIAMAVDFTDYHAFERKVLEVLFIGCAHSWGCGPDDLEAAAWELGGRGGNIGGK